MFEVFIYNAVYNPETQKIQEQPVVNWFQLKELGNNIESAQLTEANLSWVSDSSTSVMSINVSITNNAFKYFLQKHTLSALTRLVVLDSEGKIYFFGTLSDYTDVRTQQQFEFMLNFQSVKNMCNFIVAENEVASTNTQTVLDAMFASLSANYAMFTKGTTTSKSCEKSGFEHGNTIMTDAIDYFESVTNYKFEFVPRFSSLNAIEIVVNFDEQKQPEFTQFMEVGRDVVQLQTTVDFSVQRTEAKIFGQGISKFINFGDVSNSGKRSLVVNDDRYTTNDGITERALFEQSKTEKPHLNIDAELINFAINGEFKPNNTTLVVSVNADLEYSATVERIDIDLNNYYVTRVQSSVAKYKEAK